MNTEVSSLLEAEEEILLARSIEAGVLASDCLRRNDFRAASPAELVQLEREGQAAWQRFLLSNVRLVQSLATVEARRSEVSLEELFQEGFVGLAEALRRWDWRAGYKFSTYAMAWVRKHVALAAVEQAGSLPVSARTVLRARRVRGLASELEQDRSRTVSQTELSTYFGRSSRWVGRMLTLAPCCALSEAGELPCQPAEEPAWGEGDVAGALRQLPEVEREVLSHRFGFATGQAMGQRAVALRLGLSESTVRRHESRGLRRIRGWMEAMAA